MPGEVGRARVTCWCVTGLGESQTGILNLPVEDGEELVKRREWRGKGEATKGSEGLKKSELSQGGLERQDREANPSWEGLQVLLPQRIPKNNFSFDSPGQSLHRILMFNSLERLDISGET